MPSFSKNQDQWARAGLCLLVLSFTLPFLNHAFHIDEPLFLRIARQIREAPFHPYGFEYIWNLNYEPMHRIAAFPPLFPYFLALIAGGWDSPPEWRIHLALVPFALLAVLSFYSLCREFDFSSFHSFLAAALLAVSPVFVVAANLAMPDMAAVSFLLLSAALCLRGWKNERIGPLILGGIFLGLATLLRYNVAPLLVVFSLLGFTYSKTLRALLPSLVGGFFLTAWMIYSRLSLGELHTAETFSTFAQASGFVRRFWTLNNHFTLSTFLPFVAAILFWTRGPYWVLIGSFLSADLLGIYAYRYGKIYGHIFGMSLWPDLVFVGLGLFTFFFTLALSFRPVWAFRKNDPSSYRRRDFRLSLLFLWIAGVLAIPLIYRFFASKYLLLAQPPLILLLVNELSKTKPSYGRALLYLLPLGLAISLFVAGSDFALANVYRTEAHRVAQNEPNRTLWFNGHWGWQYYLEEKGARPLPYDLQGSHGPVPGDLFLKPSNVTSHSISPDLSSRLKHVSSTTYPSDLPFRTMNKGARSGFYSEHWGPLPYAISRSYPLEEFSVYVFTP